MHLRRDCSVDVRVIAPVPWFPLKSPAFGQYSRFAATPRRIVLDDGLQVTYPRYAMLPKIGVVYQPDLMARSALSDIEALRETGWMPEVIDAHYFYPDGVAAAILAEKLKLPLVITARGTDVNVVAHMPRPGKRILWAAQRAEAVVAVSTRLKDALVELGVESSKIIVLRNGVDVEMFKPIDQQIARERIGLPAGLIAACVGNFVEEKGFALAIESLKYLKEWRLVLVGDGPLRRDLEALASRLNVHHRVQFLATMPQLGLRDLYSAVDVLLLTSTREGWPNVVLESLACGTPVVGFDVGAVSEMLTNDTVGRVVATRDPRDLALSVGELMRSRSDRVRIRRHAEQFDWSSISQGQWDIFMRVQAKWRVKLGDTAGINPSNSIRCGER